MYNCLGINGSFLNYYYLNGALFCTVPIILKKNMSSGEFLLLRMQLDIIGTNYFHFLSLKKRQRDGFREEIKGFLLCRIERGVLHPSMDRNGAPGP